MIVQKRENYDLQLLNMGEAAVHDTLTSGTTIKDNQFLLYVQTTGVLGSVTLNKQPILKMLDLCLMVLTMRCSGLRLFGNNGLGNNNNQFKNKFQ